MCGISTSLRFPGQLNGQVHLSPSLSDFDPRHCSDFRKLGMNLIPFPRLHYLLPSYAPLIAPGSKSFQSSSVSELVYSLFDRHNLLVACDPRFGRYLTAATIFRGPMASQEVSSIPHSARDCILLLCRSK